MEVQQKITIKLPTSFSSVNRKQAAVLLIKLIQQRTDKGLDKNSTGFVKYSDSYKSTLDFRLAGKSASKVDLKLSGEMMRSIELLGQGPGFIVLGYEAATDVNDKASFSKAHDNGPSRDFLGVSSLEIASVVSTIEADTLGNNVRSLTESSGFSFSDFLNTKE